MNASLRKFQGRIEGARIATSKEIYSNMHIVQTQNKKKKLPSTRRPTLSERFNMTIIFIWLSKEKSDVYYGARIKYWQCVSAAPGVWESSGLQTLASGRVHAQIPRAPCHAMPCPP